MKKCFICKQNKELKDYYIHAQMKDGHLNKCKECCKQQQKDRNTTKLDYNRQRYSFSRIFSHRYINIRLRCLGKIKGSKNYVGMDYLPRLEFLAWCWEEETLKQFVPLWYQWFESGFENRLRPSIDRIDNTKGYQAGNLQWVTVSENSSKADGRKSIITERDELGRIVSAERK